MTRLSLLCSQIFSDPSCPLQISLSVKASSIQTLEFTHVTFAFHKLLPCRQSLTRRGKRLHATKAQRLTPTYAPDTSLSVSIRPPRPNLAVSLDALPLALGQGESSTVSIELSNTGGAPLRDLRLLVSDPSVLSVVGAKKGPSSEGERSVRLSRIPCSKLTFPDLFKHPHLASLSPTTCSSLARPRSFSPTVHLNLARRFRSRFSAMASTSACKSFDFSSFTRLS